MRNYSYMLYILSTLKLPRDYPYFIVLDEIHKRCFGICKSNLLKKQKYKSSSGGDWLSRSHDYEVLVKGVGNMPIIDPKTRLLHSTIAPADGSSFYYNGVFLSTPEKFRNYFTQGELLNLIDDDNWGLKIREALL